MKQQCPDCARGGILGVGNGKCSKCYGGGKVGTIADDIAGGKRSCPRCHGTGRCPTCGGSGLITGSTAPAPAAPARPRAHDELNPFDDKVAIKAVCPNCGAMDWFEWKFLGHLTDPVCGHSWYVGSGTYTLMQIRAAFAAGGRFAKHLTSGASGEGAWIAKAMGWFMGVILGLGIRLEFGVMMIPIQALAGLLQAKRTASDIVTRVIVLGVTLTGFGIGYYEMQHPTRSQFQQAQPAEFSQFARPPVSSPPPVADTPSVPQSPPPPQAAPVPDLPDFQRLAVTDYRRYNSEFLRLIGQDSLVHITKADGWVDSGFECNGCVAGSCIELLPTCEGCVLQVKAGDAIYESRLSFGSTHWGQATGFWGNSACGVCGKTGETLKFRVSPNSPVDELRFEPPRGVQ